MSKPHRTAEKSRRGAGRHAAGEDPVKRKAIIKGAERVFMKLGFDAASMDDIARTAGVSKATIYVYFKDKTELFVAMIAVRREELWQGLSEILVEDEDLKTVLTKFGVALVKSTNTDWALRTVSNCHGRRRAHAGSGAGRVRDRLFEARRSIGCIP